MKKICLTLALAGSFVLSTVMAPASTLVEHFTSNPLMDGWQVFGDTNLFQWDSTNDVLDVTWDSTKPNSYFYHPLGKTLTTNDSFCIQFDLQLNSAIVYNYGQSIAIGLLHWADATNVNFSRPNAYSPNLFEFDYFPSFDYSGYYSPDTVTASIVDDAANYNYSSDTQSLVPGVTYHVVLLHYANSIGINGVIYTNGQVMSIFPDAQNYYPSNDDGSFALDTLSITSYADDGYGDDIYAQGTVANFACASPLPVGVVKAVDAGRVRFVSDTNWIYTLEGSTDFQSWQSIAPDTVGNGTNLVLQSTNALTDKMFYRVRADLQ